MDEKKMWVFWHQRIKLKNTINTQIKKKVMNVHVMEHTLPKAKSESYIVGSSEY